MGEAEFMTSLSGTRICGMSIEWTVLGLSNGVV